MIWKDDPANESMMLFRVYRMLNDGLATRVSCRLELRGQSGRSLSKTLALATCPREGDAVAIGGDWAAFTVQVVIVAEDAAIVRLRGLVDEREEALLRSQGWA